MDLAIFGRDIENTHLLAPATAIRIHAYNDRRTGLQRFAAEPIDECLSNREAFTFDLRWLAIGAERIDEEIHMRVDPVEARNGAFEQYLLRGIEHGLAVVG
jgi:hypothetical protein